MSSYADQLRDPDRPRPPRTRWQAEHEQPGREALLAMHEAQRRVEDDLDAMWQQAMRGQL